MGLESSMSPRGRLRLRLMLTMVPTVSVTLVSATLVSDMLVSAMLPLQLLLSLPSLLWPLLLPAPLVSLPLLPRTLLDLPLLLSPLSEELTLVPDVTSPTLLESSTSPRGRLRLMPSTVPTVLATLVSDTPVWDTAMPVLATWALPLWPLSLLLWLLLLPATPTFPPLPLSPPLELPLLPSLLSEELMPELDVTSPTLLESSTLLRYCSKQLCFVRF